MSSEPAFLAAVFTRNLLILSSKKSEVPVLSEVPRYTRSRACNMWLPVLLLAATTVTYRYMRHVASAAAAVPTAATCRTARRVHKEDDDGDSASSLAL